MPGKNCMYSQYRSNIHLVWPPSCNSDHKDYYMFSRGFLLTFTFHRYREGATCKIYILYHIVDTFHIHFQQKVMNVSKTTVKSQKQVHKKRLMTGQPTGP